MKVVFLIDSLGSGGAQRQMTNVACLMKKQGVDVSFVVYSDADFFLPTLQQAEIPVHKVNAGSYVDRILQVRKTLRNSGADTVISFMTVPNIIACLAAVGKKKWKLIISERSCDARVFGGVKGMAYRMLSVFADFIVCNSEKAVQMWKENCPHLKKKMTCIYNAVNPNAVFTPAQTDRTGKYKMTVAASFQTVKNSLSVAQAVALLTDEQRAQLQIDWFGRLVAANGDDSVYKQTAAFVQGNGLQDTLLLHPETNEIFKYMANADCVGLFSHFEGLPNVICEAMTIGRAVMMTPVSDYNTLISDENGFLCADMTAQSIADALSQFLRTDRRMLTCMGEKSAEKAQSLFAAETVANKWIGLCKGEKV